MKKNKWNKLPEAVHRFFTDSSTLISKIIVTKPNSLFLHFLRSSRPVNSLYHGYSFDILLKNERDSCLNLNVAG